MTPRQLIFEGMVMLFVLMLWAGFYCLANPPAPKHPAKDMFHWVWSGE